LICVLAAVLLENLASLHSAVLSPIDCDDDEIETLTAHRRQPWKLTRLPWPMPLSALLPVRVCDLLPKRRLLTRSTHSILNGGYDRSNDSNSKSWRCSQLHISPS